MIYCGKFPNTCAVMCACVLCVGGHFGSGMGYPHTHTYIHTLAMTPNWRCFEFQEVMLLCVLLQSAGGVHAQRHTLTCVFRTCFCFVLNLKIYGLKFAIWQLRAFVKPIIVHGASLRLNAELVARSSSILTYAWASAFQIGYVRILEIPFLIYGAKNIFCKKKNIANFFK